MKRTEHLFQFPASAISKAATDEAAYHRDRIAYWKGEFDASVALVKQNATVKVTTQPVTGGERLVVVADYGNPADYQRAEQAFTQQQSHLRQAEELETQATLYRTQADRVYELAPDDVHYFRLNGRAREE